MEHVVYSNPIRLLTLTVSIEIFVFPRLQGSGPPYTQAVANIRLIGVMLAHLVLFLHVRQTHLIQLDSLRRLV